MKKKKVRRLTRTADPLARDELGENACLLLLRAVVGDVRGDNVGMHCETRTGSTGVRLLFPHYRWILAVETQPSVLFGYHHREKAELACLRP